MGGLDKKSDLLKAKFLMEMHHFKKGLLCVQILRLGIWMTVKTTTCCSSISSIKRRLKALKVTEKQQEKNEALFSPAAHP